MSILLRCRRALKVERSRKPELFFDQSTYAGVTGGNIFTRVQLTVRLYALLLARRKISRGSADLALTGESVHATRKTRVKKQFEAPAETLSQSKFRVGYTLCEQPQRCEDRSLIKAQQHQRNKKIIHPAHRPRPPDRPRPPGQAPPPTGPAPSHRPRPSSRPAQAREAGPARACARAAAAPYGSAGALKK